MRGEAISVRNRVLVLLVSLMVFLSAAAVVSLALRARAGQGLARVAEQDVPLLALVTDVAAAHLEQAIRLERVLRGSGDPARSAEAASAQASAEYEAFAQEIWRRLREARSVAAARRRRRARSQASRAAAPRWPSPSDRFPAPPPARPRSRGAPWIAASSRTPKTSSPFSPGFADRRKTPARAPLRSAGSGQS